MVEKLSTHNSTAYEDYMEKILNWMKNTTLNSTHVSWILDVVSLMSSSIKESIEPIY